jgi:hypothetical protein
MIQNATTTDIEGSFFINSTTGFCVGLNGTIYKTTNGGTNWITKTSGTTLWLNSVYFVNNNTGWIAGGSYNSGTSIVLNTINGGENWVTQSSPSNYWLSDVFFVNSSTGWAAGRYGAMIKTVTGGLPTVVPTLISPANNSFGVALTPTLFWTSPTVLYYKVQVSPVSNFSVIVDSATITTNQRTIPAGKLNLSTTYFWRVNATTNIGTGPWSDIWNFATVTTGINQIGINIPQKFYLYNNFPNPFNPSTNIKFDLANNSRVKIVVFDISGKEVSKLLDSRLGAGTYEISFNAEKLSSGVYFYRLETEKFTDVKRMILLK